MTDLAVWQISGLTRVFAILGDPVAQVHCPQLINPCFCEAGMDAVMVALHVPRERLGDCFAAIRAMQNVAGLVITVPHKAEMATLVEHLLPRGKRLGAVNVARREASGEWTADHFDGIGFVASLRKRNYDPAGKRVFLLGCGGAGAAIADALAEAGAASLCVHDANGARADSLVATLRRHYPGLALSTGVDPLGAFHLLVNATPLGMREGDSLPIPQTMLQPGRLVADIVMTPARTKLLRTAEALGCDIHYGEPMLAEQMTRMVRFFRGDAPA